MAAGATCWTEPEDWIVDLHDHLVVLRLGLVEYLAGQEMLNGAHLGLAQHVDPVCPRLGGDAPVQLGLEQRRLLRGEGYAHIESAGTGCDAIVEPQYRHQATEGSDGACVDSDVRTVAAHERAGHKAGPGRRMPAEAVGRHCGHRGIGLAPEHGVIGQRPIEQGRVDVSPGAVESPPVERGQRAEERQVGRAQAGLGQPFEDRAVAVTGLLGHGADQGMHEGFAGCDVPVRAVAAEARDGTRDESLIARSERGGAEVEFGAGVGAGAGPPGLHEDVGLRQELDEVLPLDRVLPVEDDAALVPVEDRRTLG